jgi:hypothetical protein
MDRRVTASTNPFPNHVPDGLDQHPTQVIHVLDTNYRLGLELWSLGTGTSHNYRVVDSEGHLVIQTDNLVAASDILWGGASVRRHPSCLPARQLPSVPAAAGGEPPGIRWQAPPRPSIGRALLFCCAGWLLLIAAALIVREVFG